jgi:hypothetical protein
VVEVRSSLLGNLMVKAILRGAVGDGVVGGEHLLAVFVEDGADAIAELRPQRPHKLPAARPLRT